MGKGWGKVLIGTRLEKQVSARFLQVWERIMQEGLRPGDASYSVRGMVAHKASNKLVRTLLESDCDSLLFLDSDAVVDHDIIRQFAEYEPGYEYDILQAFYPRRGWPPQPIWMKHTALGQIAEYYVMDPDYHDDVDVAGTHCVIMRREVFEKMLGDNDPAEFEWFYYPRHKPDSEDAAFSMDAKAAGFRIGATTAIRAGHLCELHSDWESYIDYLNMSGKTPLLERHSALGTMIADFTGEDRDLVMARSITGSEMVADAWRKADPQTPEAARAFYGDPANGYLYDLMMWNCQPLYQRIIQVLWTAQSVKALVMGAGLGTEVEALLANGNEVHVYELPGVLRDFLAWRFGERIKLLEWPPAEQYNMLVAVDVLEHIHPDELPAMLEMMDRALIPGGLLNMHAEICKDEFPMHYDNGRAVREWMEPRFELIGDFVWRKN